MIGYGRGFQLQMLVATTTLWVLNTYTQFVLATNVTVSAPIQVPVTGSQWYGNDGTWSAVSMRVGTPTQWVNVLVATGSSQTWVIGPGGCLLGNIGDYTCAERGAVFNHTSSSTWNYTAQFDLGLRPELRTDQQDYVYTVQDFGFGEYGTDEISFGDEVVYEEGYLAVVNDTSYFLGLLGVGTTVTNGGGVDHDSLLAHLNETGRIPSAAYGFTAGAFYRLKGLTTDLILGGYNLARFHPHTTYFTLDPNNNPVATLTSLTVTATGNAPWGPGPYTLSLTPILLEIDSSTPYLWLPLETCLQFEQSLGLTWDSATNLYFLNATGPVYQRLVQLNLTFTFTLKDYQSSSDDVVVNVPYAAFDQEISWPFTGNGTEGEPARKYFPIKRADDQTQYTLGRTFLQEAYMMVDYERGNFSVYQANTDPGSDEIVAILPPGATPTPPSSGKIPSKTTVIIAVVASVVGIAVIAGGVYGWKRWKRGKGGEEKGRLEVSGGTDKDDPLLERFAEVEGIPMQGVELAELAEQGTGVRRMELSGTGVAAVELEGCVPVSAGRGVGETSFLEV
ncbi:hypothetical protein RUND412_004007 [Rhizina undulata]